MCVCVCVCVHTTHNSSNNSSSNNKNNTHMLLFSVCVVRASNDDNPAMHTPGWLASSRRSWPSASVPKLWPRERSLSALQRSE